MTITVQIGNSDNQLTQAEWSEFVHETGKMLTNRSGQIHFHGCSHGAAKWQNAAWVAEVWNPQTAEEIRTDLRILARQFRQESIALTTGNTEFVSP